MMCINWMNKKSKYLFLFFLTTFFLLCSEIIYLQFTQEYTNDELLKKESFAKLVTLSNLDSVIKENRIKIYR